MGCILSECPALFSAQEPLSVQCVSDPTGENGVILYGHLEVPLRELPQEDVDHGFDDVEEEEKEEDEAFI